MSFDPNSNHSVSAAQASVASIRESLSIRELSRQIGDFRVVGDFEVVPGERAAILGPSGTGKTTLLRMIAGLDELDSGRVLLGSLDLTDVPAERRRIGYVFQDQALFDSMNVLENVAFGLRMQGVARVERDKRASEWLDRVGLGSRARSQVGVLSGGEAQRVALARALVTRPRLMLLDEPFSALDPALRLQLRQELKDLLNLWPVPVVMVTHDAADLEALNCVRIEVKIAKGTDGVEERRFFRAGGPDVAAQVHQR